MSKNKNWKVLERGENHNIVAIQRISDSEVFRLGEIQYGGVIEQIKTDDRFTGGAGILVKGAWTAISAIVKG